MSRRGGIYGNGLMKQSCECFLFEEHVCATPSDNEMKIHVVYFFFNSDFSTPSSVTFHS